MILGLDGEIGVVDKVVDKVWISFFCQCVIER